MIKEIFCALEEKGDKVEFSANEDREEDNQYEWPHRWIKPVVTYAVIQGSKDVGIFSKLRKAVGLSFSTWNKEIPTKFKRVHSNKTPDITIQFVDDENQDEYFKTRKSVLAYAYYPKTSKQGIVRFNDYAYNWSTDGKPILAHKVDPKHYSKNDTTKLKTFNIIHVLIHELGHSIGLSHAEINNGVDVMDPYYNGLITLSNYDKKRIRKKYGTRKFSRWNLYERLSNILNKRKRNL